MVCHVKLKSKLKIILVKPLQFLISLSFEQGEVPYQLKQTRVTYIQKEANSCEINDLRPISLNSVLSKFNEKAAH